MNVIRRPISPGRERVGDTPQIKKEIISEISVDMNREPKVFSEEALLLLKRYHWPGNVRELRNLVERLFIMSPNKEIHASDIPPPFNQIPDTKDAYASGLAANTYKEAKAIFEMAFLVRKLQEFNWNITQTAEAIGVERSNLHKKIKAYRLEDSRFP